MSPRSRCPVPDSAPTPLQALLVPLAWLLLGSISLLTWLGAQEPLAAAPAGTPAAPQHSLLNRNPPAITPMGATPTATPTLTPTPDCGLAWRVVRSPNPASSTNYLFGVAAISANDTWVVGSYDDLSLIERWNGTSWSQVPNPNVAADTLIGVAAVSANDVWAVGYYNQTGPWRTLVQHWDGTNWSIVPSPNVGSDSNILRAVSAVSANDIWAAGSYVSSTTHWRQTLVEHWDGTQWQVVPSPSPGNQDNEIYSLSALSGDDVWAVGVRYDQGLERTLTEHWDGSQWSVVPSPSLDIADLLEGVAAVSHNDAWAVGNSRNRALILHWDGNQWSIVPNPNPGDAYNYLRAVTAISANDAWAVGYYDNRNSPDQTLVEHWDGQVWTVVDSPSPGRRTNDLYGVSALSSHDIWAVGELWSGNGTPWQTLIEHYSDPCGGTPSPTPSPSPSSTPSPSPSLAASTPTLTPDWATPSPSPGPTYTPTLCPVAFRDVPPDNPFYAYIRCLACKAIVSGYLDGTFRWGNNVTRGQLAKIVSEAAGFHEPVSGQTFQDVPSGSAFYPYIERMAARGIISGYSCGGPREPCIPPEDRPYFRPNNTATRGHISKIVSNAAGYGEPAGEQVFEDVPPDRTFYEWIQRLAHRGIMSGYTCGGEGEPCLPPGDRLYFRPNNNATRGQISKLAANTLLPGCNPPARP